MTTDFHGYVAIVQHLVDVQELSVEYAIRDARVPPQWVDRVREFLVPVETLDIVRPDIIGTARRDIPFCTELSPDTPQPFLSDFKAFLASARGWDHRVIESLDRSSLEIIGHFPRPDIDQSFKTMGLVVGYIQSGKTANMAALLARAADHGYKLFIVLAGLYDDLRAQTQRRMDQELVGSSDDPERDEPFVRHAPDSQAWSRLTKSGIHGDFDPGTVQEMDREKIKLIVIKKNVRILDRLITFLRETHVDLNRLPAVVIDDESDLASINTRYGLVGPDGEELDPSGTNRRIRELVGMLPKAVYVGFTATPFANVLIDEEDESDLYPRDFIATLPEPVDYIGPRQLFGLGLSPSHLTPELEETPELDVIRLVDPHDMADLTATGTECPSFLSDAILAFILSCCARLARGQEGSHFTMLVHPSHLTADQGICAGKVEEELRAIRTYIERPRSFPTFATRARAMWENDFAPLTNGLEQESRFTARFDDIWSFSRGLVAQIEVKIINSAQPRDEGNLEYHGRPKRYIVVGGNRLARGLTLEGLSISVFKRTSSMYDTLLQMGRWFGYRRDYKDLTRLYVTQQMSDRFKDLARIELELRRDFRKYANQPNPPTPDELKPLIRSHPSMAVTSRMKMGAGGRLNLSFQGISQTVTFPVNDPRILAGNIEFTRTWIRGLGTPSIVESDEGMFIWKGVPAAVVLNFIGNYTFGPNAPAVNRTHLSAYIERQNELGELIQWDIVLPRGNSRLQPFAWSENMRSRRIERVGYTSESIKTLLSPADIDRWKEFAVRTVQDPSLGGLLLYLIDKDSGRDQLDSQGNPKTLQPDAEHSQDILGAVFSFPESRSMATVEYISQEAVD